MVQEGIALGHVVSEWDIEVDKAKIEVIERLPTLTREKGVLSFLGHASFYRRFIKDFSKTAKPFSVFFAKDTLFMFSDKCLEAFYMIKGALITAPIIQPPNWSLPFKLHVMLMIMRLGQFWGNKETRSLMPYTMLPRRSMRPNKITRPPRMSYL